MNWVSMYRAEGLRHSRTTLCVWAAVFGAGVLSLLLFADLSFVELTGLPVSDALSGTLGPALVITYVTMFAALVWADARTEGLPSSQ